MLLIRNISDAHGRFYDLMFTSTIIDRYHMTVTDVLLRDPMQVPFLAIIFAVAITLSSVCGTVAARPIQTLPKETNASADDVTVGTSAWKIDNRYTSLVCAVSHYGLSFIYGRFNSCSGDIEINFDDSDATSFRFEVDPDSIDTNDAARDIQLRGESCLDARQYGSITFESSGVEAKDEEVAGKTKRTYRVTGNLSMHGETRRITIPINLLSIGSGPDGNLRCGFISRFVINRSEFGLEGLPDEIGDSVAVTFCFQAVRDATKQVIKDPMEKEPMEKEEPLAIDPMETEEPAPVREVDPGLIDDSRKTVEQKRLEDLFIPSSSPFEEKNAIAPDDDELPTGLDGS